MPDATVELPGRLQATFVPTEHAMAWWGPLDLVSAHGLPEGRPGQCRFALPAGDRVLPVTVPVRLADLDTALPALRALPDGEPSSLGASLLAWRDAARLGESGDHTAVAARMPPAAHAVLNADETAITSAGALLTQFRQAVATASALHDTRIQATLRPYQVRGVAWLRALAASGSGGVLADDMGLGKTLQAICLLATRCQADRPHLVVCPTSLVGNWRREIRRFAPDTPVIGYHGAQRDLPDRFPAGTVVVTSYRVLRTDQALRHTHFDTVILDEAQQIKNPDAQVSRAAAALSADVRIAMTGTPVENRLAELWAILNVTNPGLLGSRSRFRQRFAVPIEQRRSPTAAARLGALVAPHLLRRGKTEVAADLPAKQHSTVTCTLTDEQARLYNNAVDRTFSAGLGSGFERRGRVLALLTALKQICNHPAQLLGDDEQLAGRSGKFDRAVEMLAEIADQGERALVFTQYRAMGELLCRHLGETLGGAPIPFLHGGLSPARRDRLVDAFQHDDSAPPVLLLSLRAAGFGLNLTRASHVVHYDRWWNPAVEDQATDRAHRIGQQRTLTVHTLVTGGTIEDHIARVHHTKRALAGVVSRDTEAALADLSDEELHSVLELNLGALA